MRLILLAAGFATRLYPITLTVPKALLPIGPTINSYTKLLIDHVLEAARGITGINRIHVVTNALFFDQFQRWALQRQPKAADIPLDLICDGTTAETERLGAVGDLQFAIEKLSINEDITVLAGDNLFTQPLTGFAEFCKAKNAPVVGVYDVGDLSLVSKYSSVRVNADGQITFFEEKPLNPNSTLVAVALYYYPHRVLPCITEYLAKGNNPDHSGRLIQWLYVRTKCYAWPVPGTWLDVGSHETLAAARRLFDKENSLSWPNQAP